MFSNLVRESPATRSVCALSSSLMTLAASLLLAALVAGCDQKSDQKAAAPPPPPAVGVQPAAMKGVAWSYEFVGRIKAINIVQVRARVEGFLEKVLFREGQDVKSGDLLYQIEKPPFQALVDQAQANVKSAEAQAVNARLQYERSLSLVRNQNIPQATVDQNKATLDSALATVMQTKAALDQAQINLGYTDISSPIEGRIGRTAFTIGNLVNAASGTLATIVSQDPIYVLFPVSQRQLEDIREARRKEDGGQEKIEILVRLANGKVYGHPGVWNYTDPQVDQQTDTLIVRATIPNPERQLVDGEFVTVVFKARKSEPRLVVPQAALQVDQAGYYVLVVDGQNKVELRRVKTGPQQDADVVIESGVRDGEKVIVDGVQKVRPGQAVQVTVLPSGDRG
jgi:membrane fusion protein, multidrug efflux system